MITLALEVLLKMNFEMSVFHVAKNMGLTKDDVFSILVQTLVMQLFPYVKNFLAL